MRVVLSLGICVFAVGLLSGCPASKQGNPEDPAPDVVELVAGDMVDGGSDLETTSAPDHPPVPCVPQEITCTAGVVWQCGEDGGHWVFVDPCAGAYGCVEGACECVGSCEGIECGPDECGNWCGICEEGWACVDAKCVCTPTCLGKECGEDGCGGECGVCPPGKPVCDNHKCESQGCTYDCSGKECGPDGCGGHCGVCPPEKPACEGHTCVVPPCVPSCSGKQCGEDGCGGDCGPCAEGQTCLGNQCAGPCDAALGVPSNMGCEFWAVDLDNVYEWGNNGDIFDAQDAQFAVIVSNASAEPAAVTVTYPSGETKQAQVAPKGSEKFELPPDWGLDDTVKGDYAFHITSSRPVSAYQFNPLSNEAVFSNDASVLFPVAYLGSEYRIVTLPQLHSDYPGYLTIVGADEGAVDVDVTATTMTYGGVGVPIFTDGDTYSFKLDPGEVLHIETVNPYGDLTGSHVVASGKVAVFGGHEAARTTTEICCGDHLEQQLPPVDTWGKRYLVTRSWPRWNEKDHLRIVAAYDDTAVALEPPLANVPMLDAGEFFSFKTGEDVEVVSSHPIMVAQFLASSHELVGPPIPEICVDNENCPAPYTCDGFGGFCIPPQCSDTQDCPSSHECKYYPDWEYFACEPLGDPAMMIVAPVDQFLESFVFVVPDAYAESYVNITAPLDFQSVSLDGKALGTDLFEPVGSTGYGVYRTAVGDGAHTLTSNKGVGVMVHGYDNDVSYGYPAGMKLDKF